MKLVYLDTETTGLDPDTHEVWEIAYAVGDGPIMSAVVPHTMLHADPEALRMNGHAERAIRLDDWTGEQSWAARHFEQEARESLKGATLVASNPSFDTAMLRARWGSEPWHHRKIDIASFSLPITGFKDGKPKGLYDIAEALGVQAPDHTAAGDVHTLRECYRKLWDRYNELHGGAS